MTAPVAAEPSAAREIDRRDAALRSATPIIVVLACVLVIAVIGCLQFGIRVGDPLIIALLAGIAWLSDSFASLVQRYSSVSLASTLIGVAVVLCGPVGAALVGLVGSGFILGTSAFRVRLYNACMSAFIGLAGGLTFGALVGTFDEPAMPIKHEVGSFLVPFIVATLVMLLVNAALLALIIRVSAAVPMSRSLRDFGEHTAPLFLVGGLISYLIVVLWIGAEVGPFTILVMAPPLVLAQWASSSTAAQASNADDAIAALVAALELNRPGSRDHGDLVAIAVEELANVHGSSDDEVQHLRRAALLHHLGKTAPGNRQPGIVDQRTAQRAADLLAGVSFLTPVRKIIAAQADPSSTQPDAVKLLTTADTLAAVVEKRLRETGGQLTPAEVSRCIWSVINAPDLDPLGRATLETASTASTLPYRILVHATRRRDLPTTVHTQ